MDYCFSSNIKAHECATTYWGILSSIMAEHTDWTVAKCKTYIVNKGLYKIAK